MRKLVRKRVEYPVLRIESTEGRSKYHWTEAVDAFICENYVTKGPVWLAEKLKASYGSIQSRARKKFGLSKFSHIDWTPERLQIVREMYPVYGAPKTSQKLGLPITAVQKKAAELRCYYEPKDEHIGLNGYKVIGKAGKRKLEHRVIMEKKLGRKLESWEIVHHKDEDKLNNDPNNLGLTTRAEHINHHRPSLVKAKRK